MILYSIIPAEVVFDGHSDEDGFELIEADYMGEKVQISPLKNNRYTIVRVLSTSPKAYLKPGLQPGTIISL